MTSLTHHQSCGHRLDLKGSSTEIPLPCSLQAAPTTTSSGEPRRASTASCPPAASSEVPDGPTNAAPARLDFKVSGFFLFGSPLGLVLALRKTVMPTLEGKPSHSSFVCSLPTSSSLLSHLRQWHYYFHSVDLMAWLEKGKQVPRKKGLAKALSRVPLTREGSA